MSNTFTLNVGEGSSIDVSYSVVQDGTYSNIKRLYLTTARVRTSLSQTTPARIFRLLITQPTTTPTGWDSTGAGGGNGWILLSARSSFAAFNNVSGSDPFSGVYTFASNSTSLVGTQTLAPQNINVGIKITLQTSTNSGSSWTNVAFTGTGTPYTFDIGDGTNRQYYTVGVDGTSSTAIKNDSPTLYFCTNYNSIYTPTLTSGTSQVVIGGDSYVAWVDPGGLVSGGSTAAGNGNDFALYVSQSSNSDGGAPGYVEDQQTLTFATTETNLMDLGLTTEGLIGSAATATSVSKTVERNDAIAFYALTDWTSVTVDRVLDSSDTPMQVNDTTTPTYYNIFTYAGTTYTLTVVNGLSGKKNIKMEVQSGPSSVSSTTMNQIVIRPGTPDGGTKAIP